MEGDAPTLAVLGLIGEIEGSAPTGAADLTRLVGEFSDGDWLIPKQKTCSQ